MDPSTQGTGAIVLSKIDAVLKLLSGFSPLPWNGSSGMYVLPNGAGRVDIVNQFLMIDWVPPESGPADFPLLLRFKSDTNTETEYGLGWSVPFHRFVETQPDNTVRVNTVIQRYEYERTLGTAYSAVPPSANLLVGSSTIGWTETQQNGTAFKYDASGVLRTIQNQAGVRWTLVWDSGFNTVQSITGPFGRRTSFAYDGASMIRRIQDPGGRISSFSVDSNGFLVRAVTPELCITSFSYSNVGTSGQCLSSRIDPLGNQTLYNYSGIPALGIIGSVQLPMGQVTTFRSGTSPPTNTFIDPRGGRWTITSDSMSRPVSSVDPFGNTTQYQWDSFASLGLVNVTDARGVETVFDYDEMPNGSYLPVAVITAAGTYEIDYDSNGRISRVVDELGNISTLVWDGNGNRLAVIDPYGVRTSYLYNANGQPMAVIDGLGNRATQVFDGQGRIAAEINPLGARTSYAYDANSQVLRLQDALGNITTTLRDDLNRITVGIDPLGKRTSYTFDLLGRLTKMTNPLGNVTSQVYNANSQLIAIIDPLGNRTSYGYDPSGNQVRVQNALGSISTSLYDLGNRLLAHIDPLLKRTSYAYDAAGNQVRYKNALGKIATSVYDAVNRLAAAVNPLLNRTSFAYDAAGGRVRVTNALGFVTSAVYDDLQRSAIAIDALLNRSSLAFDAAGRRIRVTNALGNSSTTVYDSASRQIATVDALLNRTSYAYDAVGQQVRVTNALGNISTAVYNAAGLPIASIDSLRNRTSIGYDAVGRRIRLTNALGNSSTTVYDSASRQIATVDALLNRTSYAYDAAGQQIRVTDANGQLQTLIYDAVARTVALIDATTNRTTQVYNAVGQRVALIDATQHRTSTAFDALGQEIALTDALGRRTSFSYDGAGRRDLRIDGRGLRTSYVYDARGLLTARLYADGSRVSLTYDATSQRTGLNDSTGRTTYSFDSNNRFIRVLSPISLPLTYSYDAVGQRSYLVDPEGLRFTYLYDSVGRLTRLVNPQNEITTWVYDGSNRNICTLVANATRTSYMYNAADRLTRLVNVGAGGGTLSSFSYRLDAVGNRLDVVEATGAVVTWTYDARYQLQCERRDGVNGYAITYMYDSIGNRVIKEDGGLLTSYSYDIANQLTRIQHSMGFVTYTFDSAGNQLLTETPSLQTTTYSWDGENRLVGVSLPTAAFSTFTYNGDGQRTQKIDSDGQSSYVWDFFNILLEVDANNATKARYTMHPLQTFALVSQFRSSVSSYYCFDGLGSTVQLTDSSGAITDSYIYDAWGNIVTLTGNTFNPFTYLGSIGYFLDNNPSHYFVRRRYYDCTSSRFLSEDLISDSVQFTTPYTYCLNNPLFYWDPTGLQKAIQVPNSLPNNDDVDKLFAQLLTQFGNKNGNCVKVSPVQFFATAATLGIDFDTPAKGIITRNGCVGIATVMQFCNALPDMRALIKEHPIIPNPEHLYGTKCFYSYASATAFNCGTARKLVFVKEGKFLAPPEGFVGPPGPAISDALRHFNYITEFGGYCLGANYGAIAALAANVTQSISLCKRAPGQPCGANDPEYPNAIYCVTCRKCP
jgi:RHS repeat-associated protein